MITGDSENIEHLFELGQDRFRFVEYDVTDSLHVNGELVCVLHFASPAAPDDYLQYPIKAFAEEIIETVGSDSDITYEPLPEDDPQVRQPDLTKAKEQLGWAPTVDRREGLDRTLAYFRNEIGAAAGAE